MRLHHESNLTMALARLKTVDGVTLPDTELCNAA